MYHALFNIYWNEEVTLRFPKRIVALLEGLNIDHLASCHYMERNQRSEARLYSIFNVYTDSMIRESEIEELVRKTDRNLVYNLRYADDIALYAESQ